jgi:hypothetical protein
VSFEGVLVNLRLLQLGVLSLKILAKFEWALEVLVERVRALETCCGASEEDLIGLQSLEPSVWSMMKTVCLVPVRTI